MIDGRTFDTCVALRRNMIAAGRGDAEAQRLLARHWLDVARVCAALPDDEREREAWSHAMTFARLVEANTGSAGDRGLLLELIAYGSDMATRQGDDATVSSLNSDSLAILSLAWMGEQVGDDLATWQDSERAVAHALPEEREKAQLLVAIYEAGGN